LCEKVLRDRRLVGVDDYGNDVEHPVLVQWREHTIDVYDSQCQSLVSCLAAHRASQPLPPSAPPMDLLAPTVESETSEPEGPAI
jgi:hypothetical protein